MRTGYTSVIGVYNQWMNDQQFDVHRPLGPIGRGKCMYVLWENILSCELNCNFIFIISSWNKLQLNVYWEDQCVNVSLFCYVGFYTDRFHRPIAHFVWTVVQGHVDRGHERAYKIQCYLIEAVQTKPTTKFVPRYEDYHYASVIEVPRCCNLIIREVYSRT